MKDEAGPLWILFENFMESLPFWARWAFLLGGASVALGILVVLVLLIFRRKT
jgi:hypothetical protein